ncbi:hypothetical protein SynPROSU1_00694 [Synechococcus sp. PROS-U-1]|nr:hypothetical protein SynPROSU1_00694 [Synechococcus sp. PROS-U-1]
MTANRWSCPCRHSDALEELDLTGGEQCRQHFLQRLNGIALHPLNSQLGVNAWFLKTQKNLGWP